MHDMEQKSWIAPTYIYTHSLSAYSVDSRKFFWFFEHFFFVLHQIFIKVRLNLKCIRTLACLFHSTWNKHTHNIFLHILWSFVSKGFVDSFRYLNIFFSCLLFRFYPHQTQILHNNINIKSNAKMRILCQIENGCLKSLLDDQIK